MSGSEPIWESYWRGVFGMTSETPAVVVVLLVLMIIYFMILLPAVGFISYFERKIGADFQARIGPNRTGWFGLLQPIADILKLIRKDRSAERNMRELIWLAGISMALYSTIGVLPLGTAFLLVDTEMSALIPIWAALLVALGTVLLGLDQRRVKGWIGGCRIAAQTVSSAFPCLISLFCAAIEVGGFRWTQFAESQGASPAGWTMFSSPFQFVAFLVFVISGLALTSAPPLESGFLISDISGGVAWRLSGRRLSLFRLGRFYGLFLWSVIAVVVFAGAWKLPPFLVNLLGVEVDTGMLFLLETALVLAKVLALMMIIYLIARVSPRLRADQVTDLVWRVLGPLALISLAGVALWMAGGALF